MAKKEWKPRRVRSEDERGSGSSDYIQLDEGEKFLGYALFAGDPAEDEPGYYEFLQHWVQTGKGGRSVPCAGDDCPFCEDGEKPRDVANTLWLVTKDEKGNDLGDGELRIFKANSIVIKQLTEMRSEDDPIYGIQFRVSRMDDRGNYVLQPKPKKLTKSQVKEALKDGPDFDAMVTSQLRKAMEGVAVARALDDDDDDEEEKKSSKKKDKGKAAKESKSKSKDWPDELDEEEVEVVSVDDDGNFFTAKSESYKGTKDIYTNDDIEYDLTDLSEGDTVTVTTGEMDGEGDYILSAEPEVDGGGGGDDDEHPELEDATVTITKVSKKNNSITVEDEDDNETILVGAEDDMFEDYTKGEVVVVSAEWDDDDEEYKVTAIANAEEGGGGSNDLPDKIEDEEFVVTEVDTKESTMEVESEELGLSFTLYFLDKGPASKVDFDDYEAGTKIKLEAEKDSQGDMVATAVPEVVEDDDKKDKKKQGAKGGKKGGTKKKGGKKGK